MDETLSLDGLWNSAPPATRIFDPGELAHLPEPARRYLTHAIAPGTPLASAVRLRMHGEIKLKGWLPFSAEQVINWRHGMIWKATVRMHGLPITGFDRFLDGEGAMRWKLLGIIPVMKASGPDISRSAAGRVEAESIWLPSVLCGENVAWTAADPSHPHARITLRGETTEVELTVDESGRLRSIKMPRWGNPEGGELHSADFGGVVEEEGTFGGCIIPSKLRIGWYFGSDRFEREGEFFRCTLDEAAYR
ncbi:MAG: DUF6544 family protein [Thermoanaerobaculia bacterium]